MPPWMPFATAVSLDTLDLLGTFESRVEKMWDEDEDAHVLHFCICHVKSMKQLLASEDEVASGM